MSEVHEGLDPTAEAEVAMDETATPQEQEPAPQEEEPAMQAEPEISPDLDRMRRALRELEAAKVRVERDAQRAADDMREKLVEELVPVLDNLDRTIYAADAAGESRPMLEGVELVRNQFMNVLAKWGVERIEAKHQPFDPRVHDAISVVPVSHPDAHDVVIDQIEAGYRFGDRILRPAKVVVGRVTPRWH